MKRNEKTKLFCSMLYVTLVAGIVGVLLPLPLPIIVIASAALLALSVFLFFDGEKWQSLSLIAIGFSLVSGATFAHTSQLGTSLGLAFIAIASLLIALLHAE